MGDLKISRQLWPFGFRLEYDLDKALKPGELSCVIDGVLTRLVPKGAFEGGVVRDIKGRDAVQLIHPDVPDSEKPAADELLFISGSWLSDGRGADEPERHHFTFRLHTLFEGFEGSQHIMHRCRPEHEGEYPSQVPPRLLGSAFPIEPRRFRFGLDRFRTFFISTMLGFAPSVTETLLIEGVENNLKLRIIAEALPDAGAPPFPHLIHDLSQLLESAIGVNLLAEIGRKADSKS